jgi:hypothetical protein
MERDFRLILDNKLLNKLWITPAKRDKIAPCTDNKDKTVSSQLLKQYLTKLDSKLKPLKLTRWIDVQQTAYSVLCLPQIIIFNASIE